MNNHIVYLLESLPIIGHYSGTHTHTRSCWSGQWIVVVRLHQATFVWSIERRQVQMACVHWPVFVRLLYFIFLGQLFHSHCLNFGSVLRLHQLPWPAPHCAAAVVHCACAVVIRLDFRARPGQTKKRKRSWGVANSVGECAHSTVQKYVPLRISLRPTSCPALRRWPMRFA